MAGRKQTELSDFRKIIKILGKNIIFNEHPVPAKNSQPTLEIKDVEDIL